MRSISKGRATAISLLVLAALAVGWLMWLIIRGSGPEPAVIHIQLGTDTANLSPPRRDQVRAEVGDHPHDTPASLIEFAKEIARKEKTAKGSPDDAAQLFSEMADCVSSNEIIQAQALCLTTARELAQVYPDTLKDRFEVLFSTASEDLRKLIRQSDALQH